MPLGHGSQDQRLRPLHRREKLLAGVVSAVTAVALAVLLVVSLTHADRRSGHGCIAVSLAYSTGGTQTYACGARARVMCAAVGGPSLGGAASREVARAFRTAGLRVG